MRNRLRKTPSGAMAVAFTALLIALGGTAAALPGSNSVTSDDIKAGAVRTSEIKNNHIRGVDIRNSTVRSRDVATNTLTGSDVRESSLGPVPSATTAARANSAAGVDRVSISGQAKANFGAAPVVIARLGAWRMELDCDDNSSTVNIVNVSAGNDAHLFSNALGPPFDVDFDQGQSAPIVRNSDPGEQYFRGSFGAQGPSGAAIIGFADISEEPDGAFAGASCVAHGLMFGA
jgi:hypothetical protein